MTILCSLLISPSRIHFSPVPSRLYLTVAAGLASKAAYYSHALQQQTILSGHSRRCRFTTEPPYQSKFLNQVEGTVQRVLENYKGSHDILQLPPEEREAVAIARNLRTRLQALARNQDCQQCWLQQAHCYCSQCPSIQSPPNLKRLFILIHHKEICLAVDTARLLLSSFPEKCRLVVGGIGPEYQLSMAEMMQTMKNEKSLVLFPADDAESYAQLEEKKTLDCVQDSSNDGWNVIVIDGTWAQARKLYTRFIPLQADGGPPRVQLSNEALELLSKDETAGAGAQLVPGHQLRRHPIQWKAISTLEATRLLFNDMMTDNNGSGSTTQYRPWDVLTSYQRIADAATRTQLGPHR